MAEAPVLVILAVAIPDHPGLIQSGDWAGVALLAEWLRLALQYSRKRGHAEQLKKGVTTVEKVAMPPPRASLVVFVFILLIAACGMSQLQVSGHSMEPTIKDGQRLLLDGNAYASSRPQRGDIVDFLANGRSIVSRIVGLPNERVVIRNGTVQIVSEDRPEGYTLDEPYLPPGVLTTPGAGKETAEYQVLEGYYVVLSDNREMAGGDSRAIGPVSLKDIKRRARTIP